MPAFKALAAAVGPDGQTRPLEWKRFLATAATGTNARQYVGQAFLRDLRTDQFVDDDLMVTFNTLFAINCGTSNETGKYRFMGHEFILAGFAASRRQVCSGQNRDPNDEGYAVMGFMHLLSDYLNGTWQVISRASVVFTEEDMYALVPLLAICLTPAVQKNRSVESRLLLNVIRQGFARNDPSQQRSNHSARLSRLKKRARRTWNSTLAGLRSLSRSHTLVHSKEALASWLRFGRTLGFISVRGTVPDTVEDAEREPFNACAWKDCLCRDGFKQAHSMHVCKGCWRVRYCNKICQGRDWTEGNHRSVCQRNRTA